MAADFTIKAGDTLPVFITSLANIDGSPPDLSGASVRFVMASLTSTSSGGGAATITDGPRGGVSYTFDGSQAAGSYDASFVVSYPNGATQTFPTRGYYSVIVQDSILVNPTQQLVSVADAKAVLNFSSGDKSQDEKVRRWINAVRPVIESIAGPIIPQQFEEWHDGGNTWVALTRRPSAALGTTPLYELIACSEYNGPIEWPLVIVASPDQGQLFSCMLDPLRGRVARRTAGGGVQAFPSMPQSVHVIYRAGQQAVPDNVYQATLELLRANYQQTQQASRGGWPSGGESDDALSGNVFQGFFVPNLVREMLAPNKRYPSLA